MNEKERFFYNTIKDLSNNKINKKQAEIILNVTRRHINRLIIKYNNEGENGFIHKNKGNPNKNKIHEQIILELEHLYIKDYFDYNFEAFYDEIKDNYKISYSTLVNKLKNDDIISPLSHKNTIKLYNEKMKKANDNNELDVDKKEFYETRIISYEKAHIRRSSNLYGFGEEIQMDACFKLWFGNTASALHLAIDKATKKFLFGWFEYEEITRGYFILIYNTIINYGIPKRIKTDNRNSFSTKKNNVSTTQIGMICETLKIELITTSKATSKSNIERGNKTFKDRLIAELRHNCITDIDTANEYLNKTFIPKINSKFSYKIDEKNNHMRNNNYDEFELKMIISEKYERIIDNASSIKYETNYYVPCDIKTGEVINYRKGTIFTVINNYDNELYCKIENSYYILTKIEKREETMEKEELKQEEPKKYIPPKNHPWRKFKIVSK